MNDQMTISVPPEIEPQRLDLFLAHYVNESRTKLQKLIKSGVVMVNGKVANPHHEIRAFDTILLPTKIELRPPEPEALKHQPEIIFEDNWYLVVNKPSGLVVHGGPGIHELTLAEWAVEHDPKISQVGDYPEVRPGIVHRLDRDVSGVMVIAKTQEAFHDLKHQFQIHSITKEYLALTYGRITSQTGRINFAIARKADKSGLMVARPGSTEGKEAETHFTVERYVKGFTLLRVRTLTGRGHQIRVHFKAIGHPLVGDPLYKTRKLKISKITAPRIFLHARMLGFTDLKDQPRRYEAELPRDLRQFLDRLG